MSEFSASLIPRIHPCSLLYCVCRTIISEWVPRPSVKEFTVASNSELVVEDYAAEATVNRHFSAVVLDKAKLPELVHEKIDP
jgi:hypothetical protein